MNYFTTMSALLKLDFSILTGKLSLKMIQIYCAVNVGMLGFLYGLCAAYFSADLLAAGDVPDGSYSAVKIIMAGIPVAFLMHAGAALFIWVFLKGMGGKANFLTSYFYIGVASISLWPLAPFGAAFQVLEIQMPPSLFQIITIGAATISLFYALTLNYLIIQKIYQLSQVKMGIATAITIIYIGCFLYLWV
ncbi:MAG: hypothetical protein HQK66_14125 [Desulfamplus sp.]|nr:hypothetical protein [Desulfamplus sp.]